jgi:hypothetical protein
MSLKVERKIAWPEFASEVVSPSNDRLIHEILYEAREQIRHVSDERVVDEIKAELIERISSLAGKNVQKVTRSESSSRPLTPMVTKSKSLYHLDGKTAAVFCASCKDVIRVSVKDQ